MTVKRKWMSKNSCKKIEFHVTFCKYVIQVERKVDSKETECRGEVVNLIDFGNKIKQFVVRD